MERVVRDDLGMSLYLLLEVYCLCSLVFSIQLPQFNFKINMLKDTISLYWWGGVYVTSQSPDMTELTSVFFQSIVFNYRPD